MLVMVFSLVDTEKTAESELTNSSSERPGLRLDDAL